MRLTEPRLASRNERLLGQLHAKVERDSGVATEKRNREEERSGLMTGKANRTRRTGTPRRTGSGGRTGPAARTGDAGAAAPVTAALAANPQLNRVTAQPTPAAPQPSGLTTNAVIDISHHNTIQNFSRVATAGVRAVIHKATQGTRFVDPTFESHRDQILQAGLLFGAYHFGTAGSGTDQAEHVLSVAGPDTLLVLDLEGNPQGFDMALEEAEEFVHHIAEKTGRFPGLYSGHTLKEMLSAAGIRDPQQTVLSQCWLWIAQYGPKPLIPTIWSRWTLWQYTDGAAGPLPHEVDGIGRCDRDQFNGSEAELLAFWNDATAVAARAVG
jgi:lysozyme